jgi:hypothetical protein
MKKIRRKVWHTIHLTSFLIFGASTIHTFTAGTDRANRLVQWGALTGGAMVFFLVLFRLLAPKKAQLAEERAAREAAKSTASVAG